MKFTYLLISPVLGLAFFLILKCEGVPIGKSGAKQVDISQYQNLLGGPYPPLTSEYSDYYNSDPLASLYLSMPPENFDPYQQPILSSPYYTLQNQLNQVPDYLIPTNYPYGYPNNLGYNNVPVQRPNYAYYESPATATSSNTDAALDTFKSLVECVQEKLQTMETLLANGKPVNPVNENYPTLGYVSPAQNYGPQSNLETVNAQESEQTAETRPTSASDQGDVGVQVANAIKQLQALASVQYKKAASSPANAVNHGRSSSDVLSPYFGYLGTSSPYGPDMLYGSYPSSSLGYKQQQYIPYQTGASPYEYYAPGNSNYGTYLSSSYAR